jgi:hypothetical protein
MRYFFILINSLFLFILINCNEQKNDGKSPQELDTTLKNDSAAYVPTESDKQRLLNFYSEITKYWTSEDWMNEFVSMAKEMFSEANKMLDKKENPNPKIQEMGNAFQEKIWHKYLDILYASGFKSEEEKNMVEESLSSDSIIVDMQNKVENLTKDFNAKLMKQIDPLRDAFLKRAEEMGAKRKLQQ